MTWVVCMARIVTVSVCVQWAIVRRLSGGCPPVPTPPAIQPVPLNVSRFSAFQYSPLHTFGVACTSSTSLPVRGQTRGP